jgi:D-sedoheptulose 7-phosphate isomerase
MSIDLQKFATDGADLRVRFFRDHEATVRRAAEVIQAAFEAEGKLLAFGNGGSAADAQHLAGELAGHFKRDRRALPAVALSTDTSVLTCIANDYGYDEIFSRQVQALGRAGDVAWAISTSGKSPNVLAGVKAAREQGMTVIGLTGGDGGPLAPLCDVALVVPSGVTALIQEVHLAILHAVCEILDAAFDTK